MLPVPMPDQSPGMPLWRRAVCAAAIALTACGSDGEATLGRSQNQSQTVESVAPAATSPERLAQPGELIATMRIPRLCDLEVKIFALSREEILSGINLDGNGGAGNSPLNRLKPEAIPQRDCTTTLTDAAVQRQQNPSFATRGERTRDEDYVGFPDTNRNGRKDPGEAYKASSFEPSAGYWPGTGSPGEKGKNPIFMAHRTKFSAAFASINVLQSGDLITITTPGKNTRTFNYRVTGQEVVDPSEVERVMYPEGYQTGTILTIFACEPQSSATKRIVVRAQLVA